MMGHELMARLTSAESGVWLDRLVKHKLNDDDWERIARVSDRMRNALRRRLIVVVEWIDRAAHTGLIDQVQAEVHAVTTGHSPSWVEARPMANVMEGVLDEVEGIGSGATSDLSLGIGDSGWGHRSDPKPSGLLRADDAAMADQGASWAGWLVRTTWPHPRMQHACSWLLWVICIVQVLGRSPGGGHGSVRPADADARLGIAYRGRSRGFP